MKVSESQLFGPSSISYGFKHGQLLVCFHGFSSSTVAVWHPWRTEEMDSTSGITTGICRAFLPNEPPENDHSGLFVVGWLVVSICFNVCSEKSELRMM